MTVQHRDSQRCDRCERYPLRVYLLDGEWVCANCRRKMKRIRGYYDEAVESVVKEPGG